MRWPKQTMIFWCTISYCRKASERVVTDLLDRLRGNGFRRHQPEDYHLDTDRFCREDGL